MKPKLTSPVPWKVLRNTIISTFLLMILTALVCWFGEWRTLADYSNGLIYAGAALLFISGLMYMGGQSRSIHSRGSIQGYNPMPVDDREVLLNFENSRQRQTYMSEAMSTAATLAIPAFLSIIIGLILNRIVI